MLSINPRQTLKTAAIIVLLVAAAPRDALPQRPLESAAERQQELVERIENEQSRHGPHSEGLINPLAELALLYQEVGDDALAVATIERARQVVRANYGLQSLEQAPLIQHQMALAESAGNVEATWQLEEELLSLTRQHPSDLRHGVSRRVRVLDATTAAAHADRNRLVELIRGSRFRPRVTDGRFERSSVVLRYYLNE